jgi:HlyD family secretion protein
VAEQTIARPAPKPIAPAAGKTTWLVLGVIAAGLIGASVWYFGFGAKTGHASERAAGAGEVAEGKTRVTVAHPIPHGIQKVVDQPGTVDAFEWADLHAKVSGYLKTLSVDIGSTVKADQVLAEIDDPEILKARDQAVAAVAQAKAAQVQADARIKTAQALKRTATSAVATARAELERRKSTVSYREKQYSRIQGLVQRRAVEAQLADEEQDKYESAVADLHSAEAGVQAAEAGVAEADAKIEQAQADLAEAKANVEVAQSALEKAKVLADYTRITSPYDGVVTMRAFHPGSFIRSAVEGNEKALLSIARTDKMRVVVRVPDTDVPYVDVGDPAIVRINNLPGREFKGTVARFSYIEDVDNRTMRTEIDLENPDNLLRSGMYGNVTIVVQPASKNLTVPSSALLEQMGGKGFVYVVRDGKARRLPVAIVQDDGVQAEIASGLRPDDQVVVRYNGAIADGLAVEVEPSHPGGSEKSSH